VDLDLAPQHATFRAAVRELAQGVARPHAAEVDLEHRFPEEAIEAAAAAGLLGVLIPREYGGAGLDAIAFAVCIEELAQACASTSVIVDVHTSVGSEPILLFGTEDQKQKWLVPLAQGTGLGAFGLTEPEAGSDAGNTRTTAVLEGDEWVINGTKCFITNSGTDISLLVVITAVTGDEIGKKEISNIIVPNGTLGYTVAPKYRKMGWQSSDTHELSFSDCRVPKENLLGGRGEGFKSFLKALDCGRIGVAALSVGLAQGCLEESVKYAKERVAFGRPISQYQAVSFKCADMAMEIELAHNATMKAAWLCDQGRSYRKEAAFAKLFASETCMRAASNAVQIHGGYGYIEDYPVCRYFRDAKIMEIGEGTSEVQKIVISRELGL